MRPGRARRVGQAEVGPPLTAAARAARADQWPGEDIAVTTPWCRSRARRMPSRRYVPIDPPATARGARQHCDRRWMDPRASAHSASRRSDAVRLVLPPTTTGTELDALVEVGDERYEAVVRHRQRCTELEASPAIARSRCRGLDRDGHDEGRQPRQRRRRCSRHLGVRPDDGRRRRDRDRRRADDRATPASTASGGSPTHSPSDTGAWPACRSNPEPAGWNPARSTTVRARIRLGDEPRAAASTTTACGRLAHPADPGARSACRTNRRRHEEAAPNGDEGSSHMTGPRQLDDARRRGRLRP